MAGAWAVCPGEELEKVKGGCLLAHYFISSISFFFFLFGLLIHSGLLREGVGLGNAYTGLGGMDGVQVCLLGSV